jgi:hypothetical protein
MVITPFTAAGIVEKLAVCAVESLANNNARKVTTIPNFSKRIKFFEKKEFCSKQICMVCQFFTTSVNIWYVQKYVKNDVIIMPIKKLLKCNRFH